MLNQKLQTKDSYQAPKVRFFEMDASSFLCASGAGTGGSGEDRDPWNNAPVMPEPEILGGINIFAL